MHTREEYIEICKTCVKRTTSMEKGLICSLTQEQAAFETFECPDYDLDKRAKTKLLKSSNEKRRSDKRDFWLGLFVGLVFFLAGLFMFLAGLIGGVMIVYAIILFTSGLILIIRSVIKTIVLPKKRSGNQEILDELL